MGNLCFWELKSEKKLEFVQVANPTYFFTVLCYVFAIVCEDPSYGQQLEVMQHQNRETLICIIPNTLLMQKLTVAEL